MQIKDYLVAARAKIDTPQKWTKGQFARTVGGKPIGPNCENAACFCILGAFNSVECSLSPGNERNGNSDPAKDLLRDKLEPMGYFNIPDFNDDPHTTHADVLAIFDEAIASCPN